MFFFILFLAHFQAIVIPIVLGIKSINQFKNIPKQIFIPFGFIFFGLASMFEMIDHTKTNWFYVDHSSLFNWLFYTFLALGLTCLSISVNKNRFTTGANILLCFCSIVSYLLIGKTIALFFQVIISIFLLINWQRIFKDWLFFAYPLFGIVFTTFFGTKLSITDNQIWHIFIGPAGTISVLIFYLVLKRSRNKLY